MVKRHDSGQFNDICTLEIGSTVYGKAKAIRTIKGGDFGPSEVITLESPDEKSRSVDWRIPKTLWGTAGSGDHVVLHRKTEFKYLLFTLDTQEEIATLMTQGWEALKLDLSEES